MHLTTWCTLGTNSSYCVTRVPHRFATPNILPLIHRLCRLTVAAYVWSMCVQHSCAWCLSCVRDNRSETHVGVTWLWLTYIIFLNISRQAWCVRVLYKMRAQAESWRPCLQPITLTQAADGWIEPEKLLPRCPESRLRTLEDLYFVNVAFKHWTWEKIPMNVS